MLVRSQIFEFVELHFSLTHRLTWLYIIFHQLGKTEGFLAFLFNKLSPHYGHNIENVELYLSWNICGFENHHLIRSLFVQTDVTWCLQIYRHLLDCFCNTILLLGAFWTRHLQTYIAQSNKWFYNIFFIRHFKVASECGECSDRARVELWPLLFHCVVSSNNQIFWWNINYIWCWADRRQTFYRKQFSIFSRKGRKPNFHYKLIKQQYLFTTKKQTLIIDCFLDYAKIAYFDLRHNFKTSEYS